MREIWRSNMLPGPGIALNRGNPLVRGLVAAWVPAATPGIAGRGKGTGIIRDLVFGNNAAITDLNMVPNSVFGMGVYNDATSGDFAVAPTLHPAYTATGLVSVAAWIVPGALGTGLYQILTNDPYGLGGGVRCWQFRIGSKKLDFAVWNQAATLQAATSATDLTTLTGAIHVAGTWDGAVIRVFVNGKLDGQAALVGTATAAVTYVPYIGYRMANTDFGPFLGSIGPVLWWRRGISIDEVKQLWHPTTRWSLFAPPRPSRTYAVLGSAPAGRRSWATIIGG